MPSSSQGNGRNVALPDEARPSWRPQDDQGGRTRRSASEEDERYRDEDRYGRDRGRYWEDEPWRGERRGRYGETRYGEGRYGYPPRDQSYPGSFEERAGERGGERPWSDQRAWEDRGYDPERYGAQGGYGGGRGWEAERIGVPRGYGYDNERGYASGYAGSREVMGYSRSPVSARRAYEESPGRPHEPGAMGQVGGFRGRGPAGYRRSDERIRELVCDILTEDDRVDATHVEVRVEDGEVTLTGTVDDRQQKRAAEDAIENIAGVRDIHNQLRVGGEKHRAGGGYEGEKRRT